MSSQVIQAAHGVPGLQTRRCQALQHHLAPRIRVLLVRAEAAPLSTGFRIVDPLTLPHWFECQDEIAKACESLAATLVEIARLTVGRVAHLKKDAGERPIAAGWNVEVGGDVKVGLAFVNDLLDTIAGALEGGLRRRIKGRAFRHAANKFPEGLRHPRLTGPNGTGRGELRQLRIPGTIRAFG